MLRLRPPRYPLLAVRRGAAALLAAGALALALRPSGPAPPAPGTVAVPVVVAAGDLPAGAALAAPDLRVASIPPPLRPAGSVAVAGALVGRVLASPVRAGEPLTDVRLVGAGLTALLAPGQVAAPVRLADLAVSGLVRAGDQVDVLAATPGTDRAEQVASAALVLAAPGATAEPGTRPAGAAVGEAGAAPDGLLLLAVDPATAARLAAASAGATLTVTLSRR